MNELNEKEKKKIIMRLLICLALLIAMMIIGLLI